MDKEGLVRYLTDARGHYREFVSSNYSCNEQATWREGVTDMAISFFELTETTEIRRMFEATLKGDSYIKSAVERIDVLHDAQVRSQVNLKATAIRDNLDYVAQKADMLLARINANDVPSATQILAGIKPEVNTLAVALATLEGLLNR